MSFLTLRKSMVKNQLENRGVKDILVLKAMEKVPREEFLPEQYRHVAYEDGPLPIGLGQTISQPYVVAEMTAALNLKGGEIVLEIGTGSGYQAAVLAEIAKEVYTIERMQELASTSREHLKRLGYKNVKVIVGDGHEGYDIGRQYDGIIITAACKKIPKKLCEQLKFGGRIVAPVGNRVLQDLYVFTKTKKGFDEKFIFECRFVPLIGESGW